MPKLAVHYRIQAKPGLGDKIVAAYKDYGMFEIFDGEPGTEQYVLIQSNDDPDVLWCHEIFTTYDQYEEHRLDARGGPFVPALMEMVEKSEALTGTPRLASGVSI